MNTSTPINQLIDNFLSEVDCKQNTINVYRNSLQIWVKWMVINADIRNPTKADIRLYKEWLRIDRKSSVVDNYLAPLRLFFSWLATKEIHYNITKGIKRVGKNDTHKAGYLNINEVSKMISLMSSKTIIEKRNYAIVDLMVKTGIRCIEVVGLNVCDLIMRNDGYVLKIQRKGHMEKDSLIYLPDSIVYSITEYLKCRECFNNNDPLFIRHGQCSGKRISTQTISSVIKSAIALLDIKDSERKLTAHSMRHSAAMCAAECGVEPFHIQKMLGHQSINTTMIYLREYDRKSREGTVAITALDNAIKTVLNRPQNDLNSISILI